MFIFLFNTLYLFKKYYFFFLDYSYDPNFLPPRHHGPVTAVCVDKLNNLHVMYRRDRIWDGK